MEVIMVLFGLVAIVIIGAVGVGLFFIAKEFLPFVVGAAIAIASCKAGHDNIAVLVLIAGLILTGFGVETDKGSGDDT